MTITPTGNKVLLEWISFVEDTPLELPANFDAPENGSFRVVAIGEGRLLENGTVVPITSVKVGDEVEVMPGAVVKLVPQRFGNRKLIIVPVEGVVCVVKREPADKLMPQLVGAKDLKLVQ